MNVHEADIFEENISTTNYRIKYLRIHENTFGGDQIIVLHQIA